MALTGCSSIDRSSSHASVAGRAISSTPCALASSHTSGMIRSRPLAAVPITSCDADQGTSSCGESGVWPYRFRSGVDGPFFRRHTRSASTTTSWSKGSPWIRMAPKPGIVGYASPNATSEARSSSFADRLRERSALSRCRDPNRRCESPWASRSWLIGGWLTDTWVRNEPTHTCRPKTGSCF